MKDVQVFRFRGRLTDLTVLWRIEHIDIGLDLSAALSAAGKSSTALDYDSVMSYYTALREIDMASRGKATILMQ